MNYIFSSHAKEELQIRQIPLAIAEEVLANPQQTYMQEYGKKVFQSIKTFENGKNYLVRIFVNVTQNPNIVITLYRTSKIDKYTT